MKNELLEKDPGQTIKQWLRSWKLTEPFLLATLKLWKNKVMLGQRKIGPAKVYFKGNFEGDMYGK